MLNFAPAVTSPKPVLQPFVDQVILRLTHAGRRQQVGVDAARAERAKQLDAIRDAEGEHATQVEMSVKPSLRSKLTRAAAPAHSPFGRVSASGTNHRPVSPTMVELPGRAVDVELWAHALGATKADRTRPTANWRRILITVILGP